MAYIKKFTNGAGFTGEYWRLTGLEINKFTDSIEARISCYKDKASKDENLAPFAHKTFNLKLSDINLLGNIPEQIYELLPDIKTKTGLASVNEVPFFVDAKSDEPTNQ